MGVINKHVGIVEYQMIDMLTCNVALVSHWTSSYYLSFESSIAATPNLRGLTDTRECEHIMI